MHTRCGRLELPQFLQDTTLRAERRWCERRLFFADFEIRLLGTAMTCSLIDYQATTSDFLLVLSRIPKLYVFKSRPA